MLDNAFAWHFFKNGLDLNIALKMVKEALDVFPDKPAYLDTLGCILQAKQQDTESLEIFEHAIELKKDDNDITWNVLASVYRRLGKDNEANDAVAKYNSLHKEK